MDDTFYSVLADSDIQAYLYKPEYTTEEMQVREAKAAAVIQEDMAGMVSCSRT